jgi:predicted O-methyltransferase YrrM
MKERLKGLAEKSARYFGRSLLRESANLLSLGDVVRIVQASGGEINPDQILDPVFYYRFLAQCSQHQIAEVRQLKGRQNHEDRSSKRFSTLVEVLARGVPSLPIARAREIGRHADLLRFDPTAIEFYRWSSDVGIHFELSSSFAAKGRVLSAGIRLMRPESCLELGTAYGMSSLFMASELESNGGEAQLTTVEFVEPQYGLANTVLKDRFEDRIDCLKFDIEEGLPDLARSLAAIDFVFHDANHTGESYIRDFRVLEPYMVSGSVLLFDDITWVHPAVEDTMGCYQGWLEVVANERVRRAVEIDGSLGMVQLA